MKTIEIYQPYGAVFDKVYHTRADAITLCNDNIVRILHEGKQATIRLGANQMAIIKDYNEQP